MLGDNLNNPQNNLTNQLFADWLNPSIGRGSRLKSKAFLEQYQESIGSGLMG
jgi:hypothetical protein